MWLVSSNHFFFLSFLFFALNLTTHNRSVAGSFMTGPNECNLKKRVIKIHFTSIAFWKWARSHTKRLNCNIKSIDLMSVSVFGVCIPKLPSEMTFFAVWNWENCARVSVKKSQESRKKAKEKKERKKRPYSFTDYHQEFFIIHKTILKKCIFLCFSWRSLCFKSRLLVRLSARGLPFAAYRPIARSHKYI